MKPRHRIAAILPLELEYSGRLLAGAIEYAKAHRQVQLMDLPYLVDAPDALKLRAPFPFEAALVWATIEAKWVERLLAAGLPLVSASRDWPAERLPRVSFCPQATVETAVEHLAKLQPLALLNLEYRIVGIPSKEERAQLFRLAAQRRGLTGKVEQIFRVDGADDTTLARHQPLQGGAARRLRLLLRRLPRPAGVWCGDDTLALRVCETAAELGLRVPQDLAVLGFGDFSLAATGNPPLSTIPLPGEIIGHRAFALLDGHLTGGERFAGVIPVVPPPVLVRESTLSLPTPGDAVERARRFIAERACQGITLRDVARAVSLSPQSLHDRFQQKTGHPPGEEIRLAKLSAAKRHLADLRLSIARVAHLCGFNQQSKFSNFFRRRTGLSPRAWRQAEKD